MTVVGEEEEEEVVVVSRRTATLRLYMSTVTQPQQIMRVSEGVKYLPTLSRSSIV